MTRNEVKGKKSKRNYDDDEDYEAPKLTKEENQVARFLRLKCPCKQANLNGIKVDYFIGNKLVDCLMESKFGPGTLNPAKDAPYDEKKQPLFIDRHSCFKYMQRLMQKRLFSRAFKIYKEQSDKSDETPSNLRKRKGKEAESTESNKPSPQPEKKDKKKFKLDFHEDQRFVDDNEPYVWTFDQTSTMSSIIGALLILGSIGICCFPLWPSFIREGVYYLSVGGCCFLGGIIGLAVLKYIIFAFVYVLTMGGVEFWLLPNLTEDVGFFESFLPVYTVKSNKKENVKKETETTAEPENTTETVTELSKSTHKMHDLTESTVEISSVKPEIASENLNKIQEDYDFEIVDNEDDN